MPDGGRRVLGCLLLSTALCQCGLAGARSTAHPDRLDDRAVLVQDAVHYTGPTLQEEEEAATSVKWSKHTVAADASWPSLGDVWTDVRDSVHNVTEDLGDLTEEVEHKVDDSMHETMDLVGAKLAKALKSGLDKIQVEADELLNETLKQKQRLMVFANDTRMLYEQEVLPLFETIVKEVVEICRNQWKFARDIVNGTTKALSSAMSIAGQKRVGENLRLRVESAVMNANGFMEKLLSSSKRVTDMSKLSKEQIQMILKNVNSDLTAALQQATRFVEKLQQGLRELVETISSAFAWKTAGVDGIFASVEHSATGIVWRLRSASREFVLGLHNTLTAVAESQHVDAPGWNPIPLPPIEPLPVYKGAACSRAGASVLVSTLCFLAVRSR